MPEELRRELLSRRTGSRGAGQGAGVRLRRGAAHVDVEDALAKASQSGARLMFIPAWSRPSRLTRPRDAATWLQGRWQDPHRPRRERPR